MKNNNFLFKILKGILIFIAISFILLTTYIAWGYADDYFNSKSLPKPDVVVTRLGTDENGKEKVKFESNNCRINYSYGDDKPDTYFFFNDKNPTFDNSIKPNGGIILLNKGDIISVRCFKYGTLPTTYIGFEKTVIKID
jgi:hypothetical protein